MRVLLCAILTLVCVVMLWICMIWRDRRPTVYFAAQRGDTNQLARYLARGSNVNADINCSRFTEQFEMAPLLDVAIQNGQTTTVDFLLKNGANPDQKDLRGELPLDWAIGRAHNNVPRETSLKILNMLLSAGGNPNLKRSDGYWTPLMYAAALGQTEFVRALIAAHADVNATNFYGFTALHGTRVPEVATLLIQAGANPKDWCAGESQAKASITTLTNSSAGN